MMSPCLIPATPFLSAPIPLLFMFGYDRSVIWLYLYNFIWHFSASWNELRLSNELCRKDTVQDSRSKITSVCQAETKWLSSHQKRDDNVVISFFLLCHFDFLSKPQFIVIWSICVNCSLFCCFGDAIHYVGFYFFPEYFNIIRFVDRTCIKVVICCARVVYTWFIVGT